MDPEYLSILMCPKTKGALHLASADELAQANAGRTGGEGDETLEAGLVCESGSLIYPIKDGIPVLLADEAIEIVPVAGESS